MNKRIALAATILLSAMLAMVSGADDGDGAQAAADPGGPIVAKLQALRPDLPVIGVSLTPVPNMVAVELAGGTMLYATADGQYFIAGELYEVGEQELVNLTAARYTAQRKAKLEQVDPADMVIFSAEGERKAVINVFTDVDCGFCRKLHLEVPKLNEMGVEVRYLAYPRAGIGSESYDKIVSAWCSEDPNDAITRLKRGEQVPERTCENPVAAQFALGQELGIRGTPAIMFEDGTLLPGYVPAEELISALGI